MIPNKPSPTTTAMTMKTTTLRDFLDFFRGFTLAMMGGTAGVGAKAGGGAAAGGAVVGGGA